jgi:hypothetical protein
MPKALIEFNLPEEAEEFKHVQRAGLYHSMLWEIAHYTRSLRKYDEREAIPRDELVEKLNALLSEFEF